MADRARRRDLKNAGVVAARQGRTMLADAIDKLDDEHVGTAETRALASQLSFAVSSLFGAEVGEPEGVRDRLREASGVLSGVLARLSEPSIPRALDEAGSTVARTLAILYPARAGLERELNADVSDEGPVVELPAKAMRRSRPMPAVKPDGEEGSERNIPPTREHALPPELAGLGSSAAPARVEASGTRARTTRPGFGDPTPRQERPERRTAPPPPVAEFTRPPSMVPPADSSATRVARPNADLLRDSAPHTARTEVGTPSVGPRAEPSRRRKNALELVPDADEGLVERESGSSVVPGSERRTSDRTGLTVDIGLHSATQFFTGLSGDVSKGGLFVATWAPLPIGTEVTVSFVVPGGHQVTAPGRVAWLKEPRGDEEETPGMGVRFLVLSVEDRRAIDRFLELRPPMLHEI